MDSMAKQAKKVHTKKQTSKKRVTRRRSSKSKKRRTFKKDIVMIFGAFVLFVLVGFGIYVGKNMKEEQVQRGLPLEVKEEGYSTKNLLEDLAKLQTKEPSQPFILPSVPQPKPIVKKETMVKKVPPKVVKKKPKAKPLPPKTVLSKVKKEQPKLVIILDDVHTAKQLHAIKQLGIAVTPSIFPPYQQAWHTERLVQGLSHYMVHLPMESSSRKFNRQTKTLMRNFSKQQIAQRIKEIRTLFPYAKYINNHTGSLFTADYRAMLHLYRVCIAYGFTFVDSVTTGKTKVKMIAKKLHQPYIKRDIFIDNVQTISAIHRQLKKAVRLAKKRGYAIAIGHPHKVTLKALALAKPLLKGLKVVYMDELNEHKGNR